MKDLTPTLTAPLSVRHDCLSSLGPHGFHRVAYTEWGDPSSPHVVVCVHGLTRNGRDFDVLAQRLAARARVLCPDVVGRGQSAWLSHPEDYGYPLYLADMAALIARSGARQVDWVGTSMGGLIGMLMAAQPGNPIRRMVVNDVGPFIPKAALERIAAYVGVEARFDSPQALEAHLRQVHAPFGPLTDAQWAHLAAHGSRTRPDGSLGLSYDPAIANAFRTAISDVDLWPVWRAIAAPTLITRGDRSDLLLADTAHAMIDAAPPGSQLVEFEGIGHAPMFMAEDQLAAVESFLFD
jgi:pimeloyl-ACP methyl ester carboxylesterase